MEVVVTTGAIRRAKPQSNRYHQQNNTQLFMGRMPFLSPNHRRESNHDNIIVIISVIYLLSGVVRKTTQDTVYPRDNAMRSIDKHGLWTITHTSSQRRPPTTPTPSDTYRHTRHTNKHTDHAYSLVLLTLPSGPSSSDDCLGHFWLTDLLTANAQCHTQRHKLQQYETDKMHGVTGVYVTSCGQYVKNVKNVRSGVQTW